MNNGKTHFADDATIKYIAELEHKTKVLSKALHQARAELAREVCEQEVAAIDAALKEAGLEG